MKRLEEISLGICEIKMKMRVYKKDLNTEKVTITFVEQEDVIKDTTAFYNFYLRFLYYR